jgi:hypothetical protein
MQCNLDSARAADQKVAMHRRLMHESRMSENESRKGRKSGCRAQMPETRHGTPTPRENKVRRVGLSEVGTCKAQEFFDVLGLANSFTARVEVYRPERSRKWERRMQVVCCRPVPRLARESQRRRSELTRSQGTAATVLQKPDKATVETSGVKSMHVIMTGGVKLLQILLPFDPPQQ